jgi:hypothetical protein
MSDLKASFLAVCSINDRLLCIGQSRDFLEAIIQLAIEWLRLEDVIAEHIE